MKPKMVNVQRITREDHLAWCKKRALEYVGIGDLTQAFASMTSDLTKHKETDGHIGMKLGAELLFAGHLNTPEKMRKWIEGFN